MAVPKPMSFVFRNNCFANKATSPAAKSQFLFYQFLFCTIVPHMAETKFKPLTVGLRQF